jgi:DNA anti-recombination protein RmuC
MEPENYPQEPDQVPDEEYYEEEGPQGASKTLVYLLGGLAVLLAAVAIFVSLDAKNSAKSASDTEATVSAEVTRQLQAKETAANQELTADEAKAKKESDALAKSVNASSKKIEAQSNKSIKQLDKSLKKEDTAQVEVNKQTNTELGNLHNQVLSLNEQVKSLNQRIDSLESRLRSEGN